MRECGEDLLVDISEILFNELAFFRLMQDLDTTGSKLQKEAEDEDEEEEEEEGDGATETATETETGQEDATGEGKIARAFFFQYKCDIFRLDVSMLCILLLLLLFSYTHYFLMKVHLGWKLPSEFSLKWLKLGHDIHNLLD